MKIIEEAEKYLKMPEDSVYGLGVRQFASHLDSKYELVEKPKAITGGLNNHSANWCRENGSPCNFHRQPEVEKKDWEACYDCGKCGGRVHSAFEDEHVCTPQPSKCEHELETVVLGETIRQRCVKPGCAFKEYTQQEDLSKKCEHKNKTNNIYFTKSCRDCGESLNAKPSSELPEIEELSTPCSTTQVMLKTNELVRGYTALRALNKKNHV